MEDQCSESPVHTITALILPFAAVNGNIFLSIQQNFEEDIYYRALLKELEDNGIPYTERPAIINDIAGFDEP